MARQKIKKTRPELRRQRDALKRFRRYLPTLKLKQQQLQATVLDLDRAHRQALQAVRNARAQIEPYLAILADRAGLDVEAMAKPEQVVTGLSNIAGVRLPVFEEVRFPAIRYSLFGTPAWVDQTLYDLRQVSRLQAQADVLGEQVRLLRAELTRVTQRVNLFEKRMIPDALEAIRVIRIALGDEMTAGVGRAKIAKLKITEMQHSPEQPVARYEVEGVAP